MASTSMSMQTPMLILTKDNYEKWSTLFKTLFGSQDLWEVVSDGVEQPTAKQEASMTHQERHALRTRRKKDQEALYLLLRGVDDNIYH